ncbi:unnamed protein product [Caenorhabditis nigoni]
MGPIHRGKAPNESVVIAEDSYNADLNLIGGMYRRGPQHVANIQVTCGYHTSNSQLAVNQRSPKKQFLSHRQW